MAKKTTPQTKLKKLILDNSEILNLLLIERILKIMELTEQDIKQNPSDWEKSFIHPNLFYQLNDNVKTILTLEDK